MLYLASEIGPAPKTLNLLELARKVTGTSSVSNFTVRLMHTSLSSFNGLTNYVDMTAGQTVFSQSPFTIPDGSGSCGTPPDNNFTWMTIPFQSNFVYNGTSNLIVEIIWGPRTSGSTSRAVLGGDYSMKGSFTGMVPLPIPPVLGTTTLAPTSVSGTRFRYSGPSATWSMSLSRDVRRFRM